MLKVNRDAYKIGVNEIHGLVTVLRSLAKPLGVYIGANSGFEVVIPEETEYLSRDGFMAYSSNCGGMEVTAIISTYEADNFACLERVECTECTAERQCGYEGMECSGDYDGHHDSKIRAWLKFEGLDENDEMQFYFYLGGGNGDAPYFRTKAETTFYEASFSAKSLFELNTIGKTKVSEMLKVLGGK